VFAKTMGFKCDIWSTGVMLHWLFSGRLPFWAKGKAPRLTRIEEMANIVNTVPITYDYGPWLGMSPEGRDFVARCLVRDEGTRMGVVDALGHPWLARHAAPRAGQLAATASSC
jgi:serine/threonine protein kinase